MNVNSGQYRKTTFVMRRFLFNREVFSGGFPVVENITNPFGEITGITMEEFAFLSEQEYLNRLYYFYQYLEIKYLFFKKSDWPGLETLEIPYGSDQVQCPLNYQIEDSLYANLKLNLSEVSGNKEASLDIELLRYNGTTINSQTSFNVSIMLKESFVNDFVNWEEIDGNLITVPFNYGQQKVEVLELFRYLGTDDQTKDFKNIYAKIIDVEEDSGIEIGMVNTVYTKGFTAFYMVNLISNINESYQDFPNQESLESVIINGDGLVNGAQPSFFFEFISDQKARPVFIYPSSFPDLTAIEYMNDGGMNIIDSDAFDLENGLPKRVTIEGVEYKVYAAKNMVVFSHRAKYEYKF